MTNNFSNTFNNYDQSFIHKNGNSLKLISNLISLPINSTICDLGCGAGFLGKSLCINNSKVFF